MKIISSLSKKRDANIPFAHWLVERFGMPQSVIDFGCGPGVILNELTKLIPQDMNTVFCGLDGIAEAESYLDKRINFATLDFSEYGEQESLPKVFRREFDWVISTEVAEHLPEQCALDFVFMLTMVVHAQGRIFFSAAQPGDRGGGHVNEQPKSYWRDKFIERGFEECPHDFESYFQKAKPDQKIDPLTGKRLPGYARNLMIFRRKLNG